MSRMVLVGAYVVIVPGDSVEIVAIVHGLVGDSGYPPVLIVLGQVIEVEFGWLRGRGLEDSLQ